MRRRLLFALATGVLLAPASLFAQSVILTGVVRSDAQAIIPGALVTIPALNLSQVTNDLAQYRLVIPDAQVGQAVVIQVRSIGFASAEATVTLRAGTNTRNFTLVTRAIQLDQVVVSGTAGRQEVRAQGAVVAHIDAEKIVETAPVTSVANLLQSRTPGLVMRNESGTNGTASTIRIRGASSITLSNDPLVFIDGIRVDGGAQQIYGLGGQSGSRLNDVNVNDIESIEVIKGPAAATLYGSDAVAGVINIITKKGRTGAGFVQTFNVEYGESDANFDAPRNWGVCDSRALSRPTSYPACVGQAEGTILSDSPLDRDAAFGNGTYKNANYSLSGGGQNYSAFLSLGWNRDEGTVPNNLYGQMNGRGSFNYEVRPNLRMDFQMAMIRVQTDLPNNDNNIYGYMGGGMLGDPRTIGARKDGWYAQRQTEATNSLENTDKSTRFQPRLSVNYQPWGWFRNQVTVGADLARTEAMNFWAKNDEGWWDNGPQNTGQVGEARRIEDHLTFKYLGVINRNISNSLRADLSLGAELLAERSDLTNVTGQGLVNNDVRSVNAASILLNGGQSSSEERQVGFLAQMDLSWRERVYLAFGTRRDESSSFGAESKPFYSPSVKLSYIISDEDYFRNAFDFLPNGFISQLKLRGAWGVSGRQPSSGARSTYNPATNLVGPGDLAIGVRPNDTGNAEIRAEKSREYEFGIDAGLLNDRLGLEATYFNKTGIDQILELPVPGSLGAEGPRVNIGSLRNTGFELAANARILTMDNVAFELRGSVATLENELLDLGGVPESATRKVGFPLNGEWDHKILKVDPVNNVVTVTNEREFIGNGSNYPGWDTAISGSLTLFKNLSFYAQVDGRGDRYLSDGTSEFRDRQFGIGEVSVKGAAAYGTNPDGTPTAEAIDQYMRRFGPFVNEDGDPVSRGNVEGAYLQDGTFFRLREASVFYQVPREFARKYAKASSLSVGLTMKNLHTWTDFTGLDPESDQFLTVPADRRWTMRVQVTF